MSAVQAFPQQPNPLRSKKYWHKMALAITIAVIATVLLTSQIMTETQASDATQSVGYPSGTYSQEVLSGQIILNSNGNYLMGFSVVDEAKTAVLQGNYTATNNGKMSGATMTIWSQQEFLNYFSGKNASPCYNRDLIPHSYDSLNVTLSKGVYLILINGVNSQVNILETQLYLNFTV